VSRYKADRKQIIYPGIVILLTAAARSGFIPLQFPVLRAENKTQKM
jgi:hypothetical protein